MARQRRDLRRRGLILGLRRASVVALATAVVMAVVAVIAVVGGRSTDPVDRAVAPAPGVPAEEGILLLVREDPDHRGAAGITLLAAAPDGRASATFIPSTTLVSIPGVGLDRMGLAQP